MKSLFFSRDGGTYKCEAMPAGWEYDALFKMQTADGQYYLGGYTTQGSRKEVYRRQTGGYTYDVHYVDNSNPTVHFRKGGVTYHLAKRYWSEVLDTSPATNIVINGVAIPSGSYRPDVLASMMGLGGGLGAAVKTVTIEARKYTTPMRQSGFGKYNKIFMGEYKSSFQVRAYSPYGKSEDLVMTSAAVGTIYQGWIPTTSDVDPSGVTSKVVLAGNYSAQDFHIYVP